MAKHFKIGDKVFAKVRGYPAWPARIEKIDLNTSGKSKYHVFFYGTYETCLCKTEDLFHYSENKEKYGKPMKRRGFNDALAQIEGLSSVPVLTPKIEVKTELQCSSGEGVVNFYETAGKKPLKRKRDSGIDSSVNISSGQGKQNAVPPQKKFKTSFCNTDPNDTSAFINPEIVSRSGRKIKRRKFSDEDMYDTSIVITDTNFSSSKSSYTVNIQETLYQDKMKYCITSTSGNNRQKRNSIKNEPVSDSVNGNSSVLKSDGEKIDKRVNNECLEPISRLTWFRNEARLLELDSIIRSRLCVNCANTEKTIQALQQLNALNIQPLMLKKNPRIVQTIKKLRRYVGNVEAWNFTEEQNVEFCDQAKNIRSEAESVFKKFRELFIIPDELKFSKIFEEEVLKFNKITMSLSHEKICALTKDPSVGLNAMPNIQAELETSRVAIVTQKEPSDDSNCALKMKAQAFISETSNKTI